jgi:putative tricarboxylic transport membrane protein
MDGRTIGLRDAGLGTGLMLLAVGVAIETGSITVGFGYDSVGPRVFPYLIAAGLFLSGLFTLAAALPRRAPAGPEGRGDWVAVALISVALLMQMALIQPLGWILVATVAFAIVSWAFGSRAILLNLLFGLVLASATFVLFNYGLGFRLPAGRLLSMPT